VLVFPYPPFACSLPAVKSFTARLRLQLRARSLPTSGVHSFLSPRGLRGVLLAPAEELVQLRKADTGMGPEIEHIVCCERTSCVPPT